MKMDLKIRCKVYNARLTEEGCLLNRQRAISAALRLKDSEPGMTLLVDDLDLDRLAGCSQCKRCEVYGLQDVYVNALTRDITIIADRVLNENVTQDPEEQRQKVLEKYRRYNRKR